MQKQISIRVFPNDADDANAVYRIIAKTVGIEINDITGYNILKKSIDL